MALTATVHHVDSSRGTVEPKTLPEDAPETGYPSRGKLGELGLEWLAERIPSR